MMLVAAPTGLGTQWATCCEGDGCLGIMMLWALGLLIAVLLVLTLIVRSVVMRRRTGEFPEWTWQSCEVAFATWMGLVLLGHAWANVLS